MTQNAPAACHVAGAFSRFAVPVERAHALPAAMRLMQAVPARPSGRTRLGCMTTAPQIKTTNRNAVGTAWHGAPGAVRRVAAAMPGRGAGGISTYWGEPRDDAAIPGRGAGGISLDGGENRDDAAMPGCVAGGISTYWGEPRDDAAMPGRGAGGISLARVNRDAPAMPGRGAGSVTTHARGVKPETTQQCSVAARVIYTYAARLR